MRVALLLAVVALLAGCLGNGDLVAGSQLEAATFRVVDEAGAPVPYASVTALGTDAVLARVSTDLTGHAVVPPLAQRVLVRAAGFLPAEAGPTGLVVLPRGEASPAAEDDAPGLQVLPPHDLGGMVFGHAALCERQNTCGLSEPVVEVAGDGTIYVSGTCCVGGSPPVWASRDGGATWEALRTPGVREAIGIEGDFAIDDAGNVYFTDILLGAMWLTSWDKDGNWRHTVPVPLAPLVDRPWVRAGAEDVVYFLYNTGFSTAFHRSTDGGRTFLPVPLKVFDRGLGTLAQGPERDDLWVVAGDKLYASTDGGTTWSAGETLPKPEGAADGTRPFNLRVPVVDEAGRVLVAGDWGGEDGFGVHAWIREPEGAWRVVPVGPQDATHHLAWPAAGKDGGFVIAWYGTDDDAAHPNQVADDAAWFVFLASTHDAGATWQVVRADPAPVKVGPMQRRLLDFLQLDIGPDGAAYLAYSNDVGPTRDEHTLHVRTTRGLGLAPLVFPHGPKEAAPGEAAGPGLVLQAAGS